ncbi:MAG: PDZ domain-containing protein [Acidimicrobiia bacterium]|nr:PDZ domain-containing protein [Acidimicrobiia bacterium]
MTAFVRIAALLFAMATVAYGSAWFYFARLQSASAELGLVARFDEAEHALDVVSVQAGGPAASAGLDVGDRIVRINGQLVRTVGEFEAWEQRRAQSVVGVDVQRAGEPGMIPISIRLPRTSPPTSVQGLIRSPLRDLLALFPVVFLAVSLSVLALRLEDAHAWRLALLLGAFIAVPSFPRSLAGLPGDLATFVAWYRAVCVSFTPALFYGLFAVFPVRSPIDRGLPWLKWAGFAASATLAISGIGAGGPRMPDVVSGVLGAELATSVMQTYLFGFLGLGLVSLLWNASASAGHARRKARLLVWGTLGVVMPAAETAAEIFAGLRPPTWLFPATILISFVFPMSVAYAVVKHRVLDVPVLLKRSARYLLVLRGFYVLILLMAASVAAVFALLFSRLFDVGATLGTAVGVAFGILLSAGSAPFLRRATRRIDRAFFRSAYNATAILEELADRIRTATSREALAALLERQIVQALHPRKMAVYLETAGGELRPVAVRGALPLDPLSPAAPWLVDLAGRSKPWEVPPASTTATPAVLRETQAECLVPILGRDGRLTGVIVLGPRISEEPYSGDDRRLLGSAAGQAGIELDNIRLAEQMAERLDAERAVERELDIARQVQSRLFPQRQPALATLAYAGGCVQAQQVGGDYYDFLDLGPGRVGLVVADISGKGIAGALLMANLQANLRSQYGPAAGDLGRLLTSVNRLFYENTAENQYATLVIAEYADDTRRLRFANCGHFPPLLVRADGTLEPLMPTAMVLGLFQEWDAGIEEVQLQPGDTLVLYTDGVLEAVNERHEEFGPERLADTVRTNRHLEPAALVAAVHAAVQAFSDGEQVDDLTVVAARVR